MWGEFRSQLEEITEELLDSEEPETREIYNSQTEEFVKLPLNFPAGLDIGKYVADVIAKMPEPELGPKQIDENLLNIEV